jgi:UDP-N-acetylglucosamine 4,6-dehydratase
MTKASAEKLVLAGSKDNVVVRYGNVIGSRGSVVQLFADSLKATKTINLTSPHMTRFWLTQDQAAEFTVEQGLYGTAGLHVPSVQASPVTWLAQAVAEVVGVDHYEQNIIGLRPGEKLHETMRAEHEGELMYSGDPSCWCPKGFLLSAVTQLLGQA